VGGQELTTLHLVEAAIDHRECLGDRVRLLRGRHRWAPLSRRARSCTARAGAAAPDRAAGPSPGPTRLTLPAPTDREAARRRHSTGPFPAGRGATTPAATATW